MSKKKKRGPAPRQPGNPNSQSAQLSNYTSKSKKMNPTARNLLFCDLVFLCICELCYRQEIISEAFYSISAIVGIIIMFIALWFQFTGKRADDPKNPLMK